MTVRPAERWDAWVERLRAAAERDCWRQEMASISGEVSEAVGGGGSLVERWGRAGLEVSIRSMWARGRCDVSAPTPRVFVKRLDNPFAQNFTVAHEAAHLLLHSLPTAALAPMSLSEEERFCDRFARDVVVPPPRLERELAGDPAPSAMTVLRLCGLFGANPSVLLSALDRRGGLGDTAYVLARWRGHYRRPAVVDFRIDATAGAAELFWPQERRLRKLGFARLIESAGSAAHGTYIEGRESCVMIPRRRLDAATRHNGVAGPAAWHAVRQGRDKPYLLARVDCGELAGIRLPVDDSVGDGAPRELALPGLAASW